MIVRTKYHPEEIEICVNYRYAGKVSIKFDKDKKEQPHYLAFVFEQLADTLRENADEITRRIEESKDQPE